MLPDQDTIDRIVNQELFCDDADGDPVRTTKKVNDALAVLKALGFPRRQSTNDRH